MDMYLDFTLEICMKTNALIGYEYIINDGYIVDVFTPDGGCIRWKWL